MYDKIVKKKKMLNVQSESNRLRFTQVFFFFLKNSGTQLTILQKRSVYNIVFGPFHFHNLSQLYFMNQKTILRNII